MTYNEACRKAVQNRERADREAAPHYTYTYVVCESGERIGFPHLKDWNTKQESLFWDRVARFVVKDGDEYFTCTETDLDCFYLGCEPVYTA